ncbi:MAG: hypothetical protein M1396_01565, partial [Chloroflexi bacterium]|nr:hypothetical protein [Chloroflexota bacterium]
MNVSKLLFVALSCLFIARLLALLLTCLRQPATARLGWVVSALADGVAILIGVLTVTQKTTLVLTLPGGDAFGLASLRLDGLTGFFLFLTGVIGLPLTIFSSTSFGQRERDDSWGISAAIYHLLLFAVILTISAGTVFVFLFGWELLSLMMYLAIVHRQDRFRAPAHGF